MRVTLLFFVVLTSSLLLACTDQEAEKRAQIAEARAIAAEKRATIAEERVLILEKKLSENAERAAREAEAKKSTYRKSSGKGWSAF